MAEHVLQNIAGVGCIFITLSDFVKFLNRASLVGASTAETDLLLSSSGGSGMGSGGSGGLAVDTTSSSAYSSDMVLRVV